MVVVNYQRMTDILRCEIVDQSDPWCPRTDDDLGRCDTCGTAEKFLRARILQFGKRSQKSQIRNGSEGICEVRYIHKESTDNKNTVIVDTITRGAFDSQKYILT